MSILISETSQYRINELIKERNKVVMIEGEIQYEIEGLFIKAGK